MCPFPSRVADFTLAHTQTLGVGEWAVCVRPRQPPPLAVHAEGLPTVPVPLAGSVLAILVTLQPHFTPLTGSDTWNGDTDAPSLICFRDPCPRGSQAVIDVQCASHGSHPDTVHLQTHQRSCPLVKG